MKNIKALSILLLLGSTLLLVSCNKDPWKTDWEIINDSDKMVRVELKKSNSPDFDTSFNSIHNLGTGELASGSFQSGSKERPVFTDLFPIMEVYVLEDSIYRLVSDETSSYYWELMDEDDRFQKIRFTYFE